MQGYYEALGLYEMMTPTQRKFLRLYARLLYIRDVVCRLNIKEPAKKLV